MPPTIQLPEVGSHVMFGGVVHKVVAHQPGTKKVRVEKFDGTQAVWVHVAALVNLPPKEEARLRDLERQEIQEAKLKRGREETLRRGTLALEVKQMHAAMIRVASLLEDAKPVEKDGLIEDYPEGWEPLDKEAGKVWSWLNSLYI